MPAVATELTEVWAVDVVDLDLRVRAVPNHAYLTARAAMDDLDTALADRWEDEGWLETEHGDWCRATANHEVTVRRLEVRDGD